MPHHLDEQGRICGLEPVVAQLDRWAELFEELVLCGPLVEGPPPAGFAPYGASNVALWPLPRAGGNTLAAKLAMIPTVPVWAWRTRRMARRVDAVHLRTPCNIALVAMFSTWKAVRYRYAIYAGVWHDYDGEPRFFGYQRKVLGSRWWDGPVHMYGPRNPARPNLEPFFSPSFDAGTWQRGEPIAAARRHRVATADRSGPWRVMVVGRFTPNKNQQAAVEAVRQLVASGLDVHLDLVGEGPQGPALERQVAEGGLADRVTFHGMVDHGEVMRLFGQADLHVLSTFQEGYGKVLLEGMVQGVVPVFSSSPVSDEISGNGSRAVVIDPRRPETIADAVAALVEDRERWVAMIDDARAYTATLTLEAFGERIRDLLERHWGCTFA